MKFTENQYKFSDDFKKVLIESSEGFLSGDEFEQIFKQFESNAVKFHFNSSSESNLIRIISALFDKKTFLLDALKFTHHTEIVCAISSYSNYLTDIVVRNPEYLYQVFDQHYLTSLIDPERLKIEINGSITLLKSLEAKSRLLRNYKRKYLLQIGTADILGFKDLKQVTAELSTLANVISQSLFDSCFKYIEQKYQVKLEPDYTLCSLGKLGGNELNYSSDIDLLIFYEKNSLVQSMEKEYHELIIETVQLFIREATRITETGYLYRVDFRLRPDGRNSLLTRTLADYLRYYETRGEEWERQMLVKLGFVCGNIELFNRFKSFLSGFVYPRSFSQPIRDTIRQMKKTIEDQSTDENIKLSPGGIRDIEFSVQALQLLNGGRLSNLRTGNTLEAILQLKADELISEEEFSILTESYILYRKIEHFVQLMNDKQTHSLPQSMENQNKLAHFLGYNSYSDFEEHLLKVKTEVRHIYLGITNTENNNPERKFENIIFADESRAEKDYNFLSKGLSLFGEKQFDKSTRKGFQKFESQLISYLEQSRNPDHVLENFARIIKNTAVPSIWYSAFEDNLFLQSFLKICQFSQRAIDSMSTSSRLGDALLSKRAFQKSRLETGIEETLLNLAVQHSIGSIRYPEFSQILVDAISNEINNVTLAQKIEYNYFIAGLGSFGNEELSFGSDIDLLVVVEDLDKSKNAEKDFQRLLAELRKSIPQFEIDFRLRPEGKNSPLVTDMPAYKKYINERIRTWEYHALSKIKFITGNKKLFLEFTNYVAKGFENLNRDKSVDEIFSLYRSKINLGMGSTQKINLKSNPGALLTVDTIVQLIIQTEPGLFPERIKNETPAAQLTSRILKNYNDEESYKKYVYLKNLQIGLQNCFNQKKSTLPQEKLKVENLAAYFNLSGKEELYEKIRSIFDWNNNQINKFK